MDKTDSGECRNKERGEIDGGYIEGGGLEKDII